MHFPSILPVVSSLLLASTVSSAPVDKRATPGAADLIKDVVGIDTGVKILTSHLVANSSSAYTTSTIDNTPVVSDAVTIHIPNRQGFSDANAAAKLNVLESLAVIGSVGTTVSISIPAAIAALKQRKPDYVKAKLVPTVLSSLKILINDHDTFSAALLNKLTLDPLTMTVAKAGTGAIHDSIADGIKYYS